MVKKWKQRLRFGSSSKNKEEKWFLKKRFLENGSTFLEKLIADCNGISIPIRRFSCGQILKATNIFGSSCLVSRDAIYNWYKGIIEDRCYLIKRYTNDSDIGEDYEIIQSYNDIVLSARMSNHSNFLKLLGCCLEFPFPVLLFEYAEYGHLNERGRIMVNGEESVLPWNVRLKIAKEVAIAVTYLHEAFPKITLHRDVKPTNVFLDKNWTAKLSDFSIAITLREKKSIQEDDVPISGPVIGTPGYLDPSYYVSGCLTEYIDVYSFGICLMVILTGRRAIESNGSDGDRQDILLCVKGSYDNGEFDEVIDPVMVKNITSVQRLQVEACMVLALRCCENKNEDRPKMIQVAKELKRIQRIEESVDATSGLLNPEMLENGSSIVKWIRKFGFKIEIMLILSFCISGFLIAILFRQSFS